MADASDPLKADLEIDGFRVDEVVGQGGFSTVYRAWDTNLDRWVAIKVIRLRGNTEAVQRGFVRERRITGRLSQHPNVITVYQTGELPSGEPYLIMDYYREGSLGDLVRSKGPLGWDEALTILAPIGQALDEARVQGIVHNDVKPANIFISRGVGHLGDFGIAAVTDLTTTQQSSATQYYAPPEYFLEAGRDARSDIYSLAATMFYAVEGNPPFYLGPTATMGQIMNRILTGEPPPFERFAASADQKAAINRGLARDPDDRPRTASALIENLRQSRPNPAAGPDRPTGSTIQTVPLPTPGSRGPSQDETLPPPAWSSSQSITLAASGVGPATSDLTPQGGRSTSHPTSLTPQGGRSTSDPTLPAPQTGTSASDFTFAPPRADGAPPDSSSSSGPSGSTPRFLRRAGIAAGLTVLAVAVILYVQNRGDNQPVGQFDASGEEAQQSPSSTESPATTGTDDDGSVVSDDEGLNDDEADQALAPGAVELTPVTLESEPNPSLAVWSPVSSQLATVDRDDNSISLWDATTGSLVDQTPGGPEDPLEQLVWSPNGATLAGSDDKRVYQWTLATFEPSSDFAERDEAPISLTWSPDGKRLASSGWIGGVFVKEVNGLADSFWIASDRPQIDRIVWSPTDDLLAAIAENDEISIWDTTDASLVTSIKSEAPRESLVWSGDGTDILAIEGENLVTVWDPRRGDLRGVITGSNIASIAVSPQGELVAVSDESGAIQLWSLETLQPVGQAVKVAEGPAHNLAFSPDGTVLAATSSNLIQTWHVGSGQPLAQPVGGDSDFTWLGWSPDGRYLAALDFSDELHLLAAQ